MNIFLFFTGIYISVKASLFAFKIRLIVCLNLDLVFLLDRTGIISLLWNKSILFKRKEPRVSVKLSFSL